MKLIELYKAKQKERLEYFDKFVQPTWEIEEKYSELSKQEDDLCESIIEVLLNQNIKFKELAEEHDVNQYCFDENNLDDEKRISEDDGTLHITIGKLRACFISNQDINKKEWKEIAKPIINDFKTSFGIKNITI